eukprot:4413-Heterococcus_DN1.PRE.3
MSHQQPYLQQQQQQQQHYQQQQQQSWARWEPPAFQLQVYRQLFDSAASASAVPGAVSGRAAVEFFSTSGLPREWLKHVWQLCDPTLAGSLDQPAFYAAMRLIALAQQGGQQALSLQVLHQTWHQHLALPQLQAHSNGVQHMPQQQHQQQQQHAVSLRPASSTSLPRAVAPSLVAANNDKFGDFAAAHTAVPAAAAHQPNGSALLQAAVQQSPQHAYTASTPAVATVDNDDFGDFESAADIAAASVTAAQHSYSASHGQQQQQQRQQQVTSPKAAATGAAVAAVDKFSAFDDLIEPVDAPAAVVPNSILQSTASVPVSSTLTTAGGSITSATAIADDADDLGDFEASVDVAQSPAAVSVFFSASSPQQFAVAAAD